ncbi:MAG TPA: long-chain fatty acid--CoA ligase, partial [Rhodopila sp.]|nr:long-chain fatty acid--CoA ligase [Rhodopila sp.]
HVSDNWDPMTFHCCATLMVETYTAGALAKVEKKRALNDETLRDFLRDRVSPIEMPVRVDIRESLPKTMIGKLSRKELVQEVNANGT